MNRIVLYVRDNLDVSDFVFVRLVKKRHGEIILSRKLTKYSVSFPLKIRKNVKFSFSLVKICILCTAVSCIVTRHSDSGSFCNNAYKDQVQLKF